MHQKWVFTTLGDIRAAPTIGLDGNIYIGIEKGGVNADNPDDADAIFCALNAATGHKRWTYLVRGDYPTVSPVAANGFAYFMTASGNVIALDAKTGKKNGVFPRMAPRMSPRGQQYALVVIMRYTRQP